MRAPRSPGRCVRPPGPSGRRGRTRARRSTAAPALRPWPTISLHPLEMPKACALYLTAPNDFSFWGLLLRLLFFWVGLAGHPSQKTGGGPKTHKKIPTSNDPNGSLLCTGTL